MNTDRGNGGMTLNRLLTASQMVLVFIPLILFVLISVVVLQVKTGPVVVGVILVCAVAAVFGVFLTTYVMNRQIKDRLTALSDICRNYEGGDRAVRAPVNGDDTLAQLANAINMLLDHQGAPGSAAPAGEAAALQAQIEKLLQEVSAVGDGDLRVQAEVTPDTLGVLADSFNYMIEELAKVVGRVQDTAIKVTSATRHILDNSANLAQASETQVAQIAQTTEAVEALAVFIQNVARNAQASAEAAQDALRNAATGQQAVRQTIDGMMHIRENVQETSKKIKRLGERSNEISEIVHLIEDIADQTNLLALNAAIQSAMAGEHGRGFAVVADEIRQLAERSTESTKRIGTLVKSIQGDTYEAVVAMEDSTQEVVKGSQLADEAGRALNAIFDAVERQAQMIESIARTANEQAGVSEAVAVAMGQISEITRQADAGTQDAAASASYLADLAEQLRASVSTFRLPDQAGAMGGSAVFPGMSSYAEIGGGSGNQYLPAPNGTTGEWNQSFAQQFQPLPEPGHSGSLVAASQRGGPTFGNGYGYDQYPAGNQFDYAGQQPSGSQMSLASSSFSGQQNFAASQPFEGPPAFNMPAGPADGYRGGNSSFPGFNDQPAFPGQGSYPNGQRLDNFPGFGEQPPHSPGGQPAFGEFDASRAAFPEQPFGAPPVGSGAQNPQPFSTVRQTPRVPPSTPARPRWPQDGQQQGQAPFNQDQTPYPGNGQFGQ